MVHGRQEEDRGILLHTGCEWRVRHLDVLLENHPDWAFYCTSSAEEWLERISGGPVRIDRNQKTWPFAAVLLGGRGNGIVDGSGGVGRMLRPHTPHIPPAHLQHRVLGVLAKVPQTPVMMNGDAIPFPSVERHWSSGRARWMMPSLNEVGFRGRRNKQRKVIELLMNRLN